MSVCLFVSLYAYTSAGNDISVWLGFFFDKNLNNRKNYHKIFKLFGLEITLKNKALTCFFVDHFFSTYLLLLLPDQMAIESI